MTSRNQSLDVPRNVSRNLFFAFLPVLLVAQLFLVSNFLPKAVSGWADFRAFYVGGYMLRAGLRHSFYDQGLQQDLENQMVSHDQLLSSSHPAVEYLLFVPLSYFSYRTAYFIMLAVNVCLLGTAFALLRAKIRDDMLLALIFAGFLPAWFSIINGQDNIILLVLACLILRTDNDLVAGLLLGLGAFKFQMIIPVALLYLLWKRWRFVTGAAISALALAACSIALTGIQQSKLYVSSIGAMEQCKTIMLPNLRGIAAALHGGTWLIAIASIILLLLCSRLRPSLSVALSATCLIAYHNDLTLLLIPIVMQRGWLQWAGTVTAIVPGFGYLGGLPILLGIGQNRSNQTSSSQSGEQQLVHGRLTVT